MWSCCYRRHVIMAFPSFDTTTNSWAPQADISWPSGPARDSEFVRFPIRVMTEAEAVACALRNGKSWIDSQLKQRPNRGDETAARAAFSRTVIERAMTSPFAIEGAAAGFSFRRFKSAMIGLGMQTSERSLRKSYDALMKLQKSGSCSLAEIRAKLERSHQSATASPGVHAGARLRLPLTQRDWRRLT